jgi:hypothetical protein
MFQVEICSQQLEICKSVCMCSVFRVYHIRIIAKKIGSHDMKQTDSSIIIVRNVCVLTSASIVYLFFTRSWSAIIGTKLFFTRLWSAIIGTKQPKVNHNNGEDATHAHFLQLFLCGTHGIYIYIFFITWTLRMSDNLPERVQILCHVHIICITIPQVLVDRTQHPPFFFFFFSISMA